MESGFTERFGTIADAMFAWATLHVRPPLRARLDPEDLLQEVACRAFEAYATYDPAQGSFRGWAFGIARNVLREALRQLARASVTRLDTERVARLPDAATSITRRIVRDESLRRFLERLDRLSEEDRRVLVYRGLEGLEHAEVARLLQVTPETATKRWQRLRDRLREEEAPPGLLVA